MNHKEYRNLYQLKLGIELILGSSIHHINWNSNNCKYYNLVAIPQDLHDRINLMFTKFPKLCKKLCRRLPFVMSKKIVIEFQEYINVYKELNYWILVRDTIKNEGYEEASKKFDNIGLIYKGRKY